MQTLCIDKTWNGGAIGADERVQLELGLADDSLRVLVDAPFHGDSPPPMPPGSTPGLWNHEVVELFVASSAAGGVVHYLELELGPFGHHLALSFRGVRCQIALHDELPLRVERAQGRWRGEAELPLSWLPKSPWRANAYAIHGSGADRRYLAWQPVPGEKPDFHRPEVFQALRMHAQAGVVV
jgi:hypothetical protein